MPYRQTPRRPASPHVARARAIPLESPRERRQRQLAMRVMGALVGLTLVAGGLLTAFNAHAGTTAQATASAASAAAATHGTVQSVQAVQVKGKRSGVGVVAGAVLGGLVGNQMGKGTGNTVMTVGGAVAGGYAGNEVEKNVKKHTVYKTTVKLDDGTVHEYTVSQQFAVGAKVNVSGKKLTAAAN